MRIFSFLYIKEGVCSYIKLKLFGIYRFYT